MEFSEDLKVKILQCFIMKELSYKKTVAEIAKMEFANNMLPLLNNLECALQELETIQNELDYKLSDNQMLFIHIALENNLELSYDYSGRGMYGKQCPSIVTDDNRDLLKFNGVSIKQDGMFCNVVVYAEN